ncbi:unnamed protein product [Rhizoctonia solani]|uniref:Aspartate--tRNA ligase, cytoplasmic n=1 Tax=Rhizoctonia solani TaxID=456999 RepID=A0A8H2WV96_9AGAM|nr:unnamed protein product [Rhizoctonia solani]
MSEPPASTESPKDIQAAATEGDKGPSKNALKKAAKEAEKAKKAAERAAKEAEQAAARAAADVDYSEQSYGKLPLNQSQERPGRVRAQISTFNASKDGESVILRARVHTSRAQGSKMVFFALRQRQHTVQALLSVTPETVSKQMVKWAASVPLESIVLVEGVVKRSPEEIKGATIKDAEVHIKKIHTISEPEVRLPFNIEDADKAQDDEREVPTVSFDTRLKNRVLDLRTQTSQSIFIMQSAVTDLFRQSLQAQGFIEIHSPKLQGAATESGASVFRVDYFKGNAFLAQSPQLAKQMAIGADFERVYEIGPVFRAENSFTHRHLTEFTGLDLEMTIEEHYHEVMDVLDNMLLHIFNGLKTKFSAEIEAVRKVYPSTEFTWLEKTLRLQWKDAIALLRENGVEIGDFDDINTETEKFLGKLVKEKYNTDYYILDKFPLVLRPFYTMPDPVDPNYSNSYDFFMRGEEILSGAQRVHDTKMLEKRMVEVGIKPEDMQGYLDGFRMGIPPHGGGGIGLERVVMLFLKLGNIRNASLFPRDPKRLEPKKSGLYVYATISHVYFVFIDCDVLSFITPRQPVLEATMSYRNHPRTITLFLNPEDILALARVNKFIRALLMRRSAKHIWRTAERNVEKLPPCPRHLTNPQYAVLVFTRECSSCGVIVSRMMDYALGVRLCNACRSAEIVKLSYAPEPLWDCVPTSSFAKKHRMTETDFALKSEIDNLLDRVCSLPNDLDHPKVQRWITKKVKQKLERDKHATALIEYALHTAGEKRKAWNDQKSRRAQEVKTRLLALGWKEKHIAIVKSDSLKAWNSLVNLHKPITNQAWERLYPKLLRLLKFSKRQLRLARTETRRLDRYKVVEEMLTETRGAVSARVEMADISHTSLSKKGIPYMPFPSLSELVEYPIFKDLVETDRPTEATKIKFRSNSILVDKAVSEWRARLETHLIGLVNYGRNIRKRECWVGNELITDPVQFSFQFTAASYTFITPENSILFRADSVFACNRYPLQLAFYPGTFTKYLDEEFKMPRLNEDGTSVLDSFCSKVKYHTRGASCAAALLKGLGRSDASHVEMEALGERFICIDFALPTRI